MLIKRLSGMPCLCVLLLTQGAIAQTNPAWLGRPFVKIIKQGDPIPGATGGVFNKLEAFTVHDGTIHIVAGQSSNQKGLFRWQGGVLTSLVYTNTMAPTGSRFDTVHFATDEVGGVVNFVAEVYYGNPGFIYGLFQLTSGGITTVFDSAHVYDGKTFSGFGYPVRAGSAVVWGSQFARDGVLQQGLFKWDGGSLKTVVDGSTDLPGSLGLFAGQPGYYQIGFDGLSIGFVGTDGGTATRTNGIYRVDADGAITKLIDGNDVHPGTPAKTYYQRGYKFANVNVDVAGTNSVYGKTTLVSSAAENSFYSTDGFRYSNGTFNAATSTFGTDGTSEWVLQPVESDYTTPTYLDGLTWDRIDLVDGQGDDVAFLVHFTDGTFGIYAAIGPVPGGTELVLASPAVINGVFQFRFTSQSGKHYRVDAKAALSDSVWDPRNTIAGTGSQITFSEPATNGAAYYRVVQTD